MNSEKNKNSWYIIDLSKENLGRISSDIASLLIGKRKVDYKPNIDSGNYVVAINSDQIKMSGNKENVKKYYKHTGYIGNSKVFDFKDLKEKDSGLIVKMAVKGMLPKNKMQEKRLSRLKIYKSDKHPHQNIKFENK